MEIQPKEEKIVGAWVLQGSNVVEDEASKRINWLIENSLTEIAILNWQAICQDETDGRYWLLDYPQSHLQGGGPPSLECVSEKAVERMVKKHDNKQG